MRIKDLPKISRPRERAFTYGIEALSDEELLAIIIGSGVKNKSALEIASSLLKTYMNLSLLSKAKLMSLKEEFGLSKISALKLEATFEFHRRLISSKYQEFTSMKHIENVYQRYQYLEDHEQELFIILMLDNKYQILKEKILYQGTQNSVELSIKEIVVELLQTNTKKFILIHNHPNGEIYPSKEDIASTALIAEKCDMLNIKLLDHLIIYKGGYYSFKENNQKFAY